MSSIFERPIRPYIALETYQPTANPFVIGAGRIGATKLRPAGTPIVWTDWTNKVMNVNAERGGSVVDLAHRSEVGTLTVTLRDLSLDLANPEFTAGQRVRLLHVNGTKRRAIFTGTIREIGMHQLRMGARRRPVSVLQFVAVDAVREQNETTRYGALPETGSETLATRLDRLSRTANAPIAQPTEPIPGLLGRTVYESSISNHLDIACNTVGAFWYVDGDGITRVRRRRMVVTWKEQQRNRVLNPSFEINLTGWTAARAAVARDTTRSRYGNASMKVTPNSTAAVQYAIQDLAAASRTPVTGGETVPVLASVWSPRPANWVTQLYEYDEAGTLLLPIVQSVQKWASAETWTDFRFDLTVKPAARSVRIVVSPALPLALNEAYWLDAVALGTPTYFDGSTEAGGLNSRTSWTGVPFLSPSILSVPENVTALVERGQEFPGYPWPAGTLRMIRYTAGRGSSVTYNGIDYDNHGAQDDPDDPGTWIADDQTFTGIRRTPSVIRYGLRVATLPTNFPAKPTNLEAADPSNILSPYDGDSIVIQTLVWNAQEDITRVPDLDVGSYVQLPLLGDMSAAPWRNYIVGGVRHTITPTRWLIELKLIGVIRDL